jgi:hypothetical protein
MQAVDRRFVEREVFRRTRRRERICFRRLTALGGRRLGYGWWERALSNWGFVGGRQQVTPGA